MQGAVQALHVLSEVSPHSPEGQGLIQVFELRKLGSEQLVHVVGTPVQVTQGDVQLKFLQVLSATSPVVPGGQGSTHSCELKKFGAVQLVQVVAVPEHVVHGLVQALHCRSVESP